MKKNKILIASIIVVAVSFIGIIAAMFATGKFNSLKSSFESESTTAAITETTQPSLQAQGRPKSAQPESVVAGVYGNYGDNSAAELADFSKLGMNTVIFELNETNTNKVAALFEAAKANKLYFGVRANVSENSDYVTAFIEGFNADFVILSGNDETLSDFEEKTSKICKEIKTIDPLTTIGIEPTICSKASASVTNLVASGDCDFVFLCQEKGKESAFETAQAIWNEESCNLWLCHDLSGISSYSTEKSAETVESIMASADMSLCKGLAFAPYTEISEAKGTAAETVLNYIQKRDTYLLDKEFSITSHKNTKITVEQSKITFRGTSSPVYDLLCNGQKLTVAKTGDFSVDCELTPGSNEIKFEHKGKTYKYDVTYKIKLLKSVSPSDDLTVPGGMEIEFKAVALKKSDVSVTFNGKTYKMALASSETGEDTSPDSESDFATFRAAVTAPEGRESAQKLGKFKVTAKYSGLTESKNGAEVVIKAKEVVTQPPTTTAPETTTETSTSVVTSTDVSASQDSSETTSAATESTTEEKTVPSGERLQKYFYTENYGLGSARICEIIDEYVEVFPGNTTSTFSVPDCSPFLKTTVDYIVDETRLDGEKFYILASGFKVPLKRTERLASGSNGSITHLSVKDGYKMPQNSIKVVSSGTSNGKTVIKLDMNRLVPFNAKLLGQSYSDYEGRPVRVSSLTCNALEFTFYDTVTAEGNISVSNSVCTGGKWTSDKAKSTVTLTLELSNSGKFYGFHYEYDKDGYLVISVSHKPSSLQGYTIMLDPGHGGVDSGAVCAVSSSSYGYEKQINLSIATKVKDLLEEEGAKVVMTRTTDKWVCYADRNGAVRTHDPDMFIAIHCDSSTSASAVGTSAFYYRAYSQPLAAAVHESIVNAYKTQIYSDKSESFKNSISRGADFYAFRVTRVEECPAILIEYGFVSNTSECQVLQTAKNRDILAQATVDGIKKYISAS